MSYNTFLNEFKKNQNIKRLHIGSKLPNLEFNNTVDSKIVLVNLH